MHYAEIIITHELSFTVLLLSCTNIRKGYYSLMLEAVFI